MARIRSRALLCFLHDVGENTHNLAGVIDVIFPHIERECVPLEPQELPGATGGDYTEEAAIGRCPDPS
jgi:hypothetical protein